MATRSFGMIAELNVNYSDVEDLITKSMAWIEGGSRRVVPEWRASAESGRVLKDPSKKNPEEPLGKQGDLIFLLTLTSGRGNHPRVINYSGEKTWERLRGAIPDMGRGDLEIRHIGPSGFPDDYISLGVVRLGGTNGMLRLYMTFLESEIALNGARLSRRISLMQDFSRFHGVRFGHVSYYYGLHMPTAYEDALNVDPLTSILDRPQFSRGYSWVTLVTGSQVDRIQRDDRAREAFESLPLGALGHDCYWVQAADSWQEYVASDLSVINQAFAPVLIPGAPKARVGTKMNLGLPPQLVYQGI